MRLAKSSRTLLPLALSAVLASYAFAQDHPNVQPGAVRDQLTKPVPAAPPPAGAPQAPAPSAAKPPAPTTGKGQAKVPAKAPAKAPTKAPEKGPEKAPAKVQEKAPAKAPEKTAKAPAAAPDKAKTASANGAKPPVEKPQAEKPVVRRDPFDTLLTKARATDAPPTNLPPGKAGLIVETLRINGIVHSANGMIAIVSNSQQRVYFLREGDKLYDGSVDKIELAGISFKEIGKDAFGKPLERMVMKRLYPSPGEEK